MRNCLVNLLMPLVLICAAGCAHVHTTAAVDVKDMGERIQTKYKYKIGYKFGDRYKMGGDFFLKNRLSPDRWMIDEQLMKDFTKWQPDVFDVDGIPITFLEEQVVKDGPGERKVGLSGLLFLFSCTIIPMVETAHFHETWPFHINGEKATGNRTSLEACVCADGAFGWTPLRWLLCWWDRGTCYTGKRKFDSHVMNSGNFPFVDKEVKKRAMAYGLAVRLKELEDNGQIGKDIAVNAIASTEMSTQTSFEIPVEIVRCENVTGRDFEYDFVLRSKGGDKLKLADYERIRSAFRAAIVNMYCMKYLEANPRSLVTDFTRYTMGGEYVTGRVSVMTIEVKTVFYDGAKRTGRMSAKIGVNQFEDVRRYIRNHIEELATRNNIAIDGDALPKGARFYTGNETLNENGLLEVEFKTE